MAIAGYAKYNTGAPESVNSNLWKLLYMIRRALSMSPLVLCLKIYCRLTYTVAATLSRLTDYSAGSYQKLLNPVNMPPRFPYGMPSNGNAKPLQVIEYLLNHYFDLLGSGWVRVFHGMKCRGLEGYRYDMGETVQVDAEGRWLKGRINRSNLTEAQRIWKLVDPEYKPIDWNLDFKSGYRWSEKTWYKNIKFGHVLGADVKVPWELARMQHLPQLALVFQSLPSASEKRVPLQREFRNQILDFMATNPPRFGVNWVCPMDVAIRAANWLLAYDLFRAGKARFDDDFKEVFISSIYEHGIQIVNNLEWHHQIRHNHYLADIAGLAFIATYLPATSQTDAWLAFAVQELNNEVGHQFYPDGGNFEGSTAYHRLSAEMVYFATSLILGLPQERLEKLKNYDHKMLKTGMGKPKLKPAPLFFYKLPECSTPCAEESLFSASYFERMERMAEFIMDITKPDGHILQIGDNDSGRFLKLDPKYARMKVSQARERFANLDEYSELPDDADYYMEDHLDCSHLVAAAYGLFGRNDYADWLGGEDKAKLRPDANYIICISGGIQIASQQRFQSDKVQQVEKPIIGSQDASKILLEKVYSKAEDHLRIKTFSIPGDNLRQDLKLKSYPDFGIYLFKSMSNYVAVRCWSGRTPFLTGHMHNDQFTVEIVIDGKSVLSDPGTYVYTPLPTMRNKYRSVKAHFTSWPFHSEPASLEPDIFCLPAPQVGQVMYFGSNGFWGKLSKSFSNIEIVVILESNKISVIHTPNSIIKKEDVLFSPGYGIRQRH